MAFKAVIFDLDGTLLDTLEDIGHAVNRVLSAKGFPTHDMSAFRYFVGEGVVVLIHRALPQDARDEATIGSCVEAFREDYAENWRVKTRPYPGIGELLEGLGVQGIKMAVLSNKPDQITRTSVAHFFPKIPFEAVVGHSRDLPLKPDPSGALKLAARLGMAPARILYVGDSGVDMRTAVAAHMCPVGALWGFRTAEELKANGAWKLVGAPAELRHILQASCA